MRTLLLLALCLLLAIPAHALVVGRGGAVYPIKERDFLEVIAERIAGIDPRALQEKLQNVIQDEARTFRPHDAVGDCPLRIKMSCTGWICRSRSRRNWQKP